MARDEAYLLAEKKIEEARRSGAEKLDLSAKYNYKHLRSCVKTSSAFKYFARNFSASLPW